jgi:hypothetical protein
MAMPKATVSKATSLIPKWRVPKAMIGATVCRREESEEFVSEVGMRHRRPRGYQA